MSDDWVDNYFREIRRDMIRAKYKDYAECILLSLLGVALAALIVAFVTWLTIG